MNEQRVPPSKQKNVLELIASYCFPEEVTEKAKQYYLEQKQRLGPQRNEGHKKNLAFYCIYQAHLLLMIPFSPIELAKSMNRHKMKIGKILTKYTLLGFEPVIVRYTAFDFLEIYSEYAGLPHDKHEALIKIATRSYTNDPTLYDASPQKIAAAVVNYFHVINKYPYDKELFLRRADTTLGSLDSYTKYLRSIDC